MDLSERQNSNKALRLLKAQRQHYSGAKLWWRWDFILTVVITSMISILRAALPSIDLSDVASAWAAIVTLLSICWISPTFRRKQGEAAAIQEEFDCEVLQIPFSALTKKIPTDKIVDLASKYDRLKKPERDLVDWYPRALGKLPDEIVTAACQRINSRWDDRLRSRYTAFLIILLVAFALIVLGVGIFLDKTIPAILLSTLLPLLPGLVFLIKQLRENSATVQRLADLAGHSQKRLDLLMAGETPPCSSRDVQNEILQHRKSVALIPDWFFRRFREKEEQSMKAYAEHLAEEFQSRHQG
jgi:hypothetical protein